MCPNHRKYTAGCRPCQHAANDYNRGRHAKIVAGTWRPPVPVGKVRAHIKRLRQRMSIAEIAERARLSADTLYDIGSPKSHRKTVNGDTAERILAVTMPAGRRALPRRGGRHLVPALASRRRMQAMARMGHAVRHQAIAADVGRASATRIASDNPAVQLHWCTADVEQRIAALYDEWSLVVVDDANGRRVRAVAVRNKWVSPLAWDDDTIGDPAARPSLDAPRRRRDEIDPAYVLGAVIGDIPAHELTTAERVEAVAYLARTRHLDAEIAEVTRWDEGRVDDEDRPERALRDGEEPVRGHQAVAAFRRNHGIPAAAPRYGTHHPAPNIPHDVDELSGAA